LKLKSNTRNKMFPHNMGGAKRDYMQLLIGLTWFTVLAIMLLAKMKAIQDVIVLIFLLLMTGIQNMEMFISDKRWTINFMAVRNHVRWECFWCFLLSFLTFEAVQHFGNINQTVHDYMFFGWLYQVVSLAFHLLSRNRVWHLNPIITIATYHGYMIKDFDESSSDKAGSSSDGPPGGAAAMKKRPRSVMTDKQCFFYVFCEAAGMLLGLLLHLGRRSRREDETWKILEPIMLSEEKPFMVAEFVAAAVFNYLIVNTMCQRARAQIQKTGAGKGYMDGGSAGGVQLQGDDSDQAKIL